MSPYEFRRDADGRPLWHAPVPHPTDPHAFGPCQLCGQEWPCEEGKARTAPIAVSGIWLRNHEGAIEVLAEIEGEWRVVISQHYRDGDLLSHFVAPLGMRHARVATQENRHEA